MANTCPATDRTVETTITEAAAPSVGTDSTSAEQHMARELRLGIEAALAAPDLRADKVADLRQRIAAGQYRVSDAALARKLREFLA